MRKYHLDAIFFNYFAIDKGICNSEGGINEHAVAYAALCGVRLISAKDLFNYLSIHGVDVISNTAHALHSPGERQFHYFLEGSFLDYHDVLST